MREIIFTSAIMVILYMSVQAQSTPIDEKSGDTLLIEEIEFIGKKIFNTDVSQSFDVENEKSGSIPQIDQFLNKAPGIEMQLGALNTNRINIRGIGSRSPFATSKLKAYLDDIPLTDGAGETSLEDINLNIVNRIDLIKGPNSSIYGGTLGGVILFKTNNNLSDSPQSSITLNQGSYGMKRVNADYYRDWNNKKQITYVNAEFLENSGYRDNNEYDKFSSTIIHKIIGESSYWNILFNLIKLKSEIPSAISLNDYLTNPTSAAANWASAMGYEDNLKIRLGINYNKYFSTKSSFIGTIFSSYYNAYEFRPFNVLDDDSRLFGIRGRYLYDHNRISFTLGTEVSMENYHWKIFETLNTSQGSLLQQNKSVRTQYQLFSQFQYILSQKFLLFGGVNVNSAVFDIDYQLIDETTKKSYDWYFVPRMGVEFTGSDIIELRFQISKGMVFPGLDESLDPSGFFISYLKPEQGLNYELTSAWQISKRLKLGSSFFLMNVNDILVNRQDVNGQSFAINAGKTRHLGIEPTIDWRVLDGKESTINLSFAGSFGKYEFTDFAGTSTYNGNKLTGVASSKYNISLDLHTPELNIKSILRYVSDIPVDDGNTFYNEAYFVQRLLLDRNIDIFSQNIEVSLSIDNLWNAKYASMISVNPPAFGGNPPRIYYPGLPRNYTLGLKYIFQ